MKFLIVKVPKNNEYTYQAAYAIISSLNEKSHKQGLFGGLFSKGQARYYSFNILTIKQSIYFIVGANENDFPHLKNQLLAQYSRADLAELDNLESLGMPDLESCDIGEVNLLKSEYTPIQTIGKFTDIDPLTSVLSSVSRSPDPNALFWIQMLITPAKSNWQTKALFKTSQLALKETKSAQSEVSMIQEKLKHTGFSVYMRIITDRPANTALVASAFMIFSMPGGNSLTVKRPSNFNKSKLQNSIKLHKLDGHSFLLNSLEISTLWHMPNGKIDIPNIVWGKNLQMEPPENLPAAHEGIDDTEKKDITFIGKTIYKNNPVIFGIKSLDRLRHVYIVGKTGTGKSVLIDNMAIEDIRKGAGVAVLDPHGDAIDTIINYIPKNRIKDVCYFDPSDPEYAYPLNILEMDDKHQKELLVSGIIAIFYKLYSNSWGPRMEHILRNILFTLTYTENATLPDVMKLVHNVKYRKKVLEKIDDQLIKDFWSKEFDAMSESFRNEAVSPIMNKVGQFVTSPMIRKIIQWPKSKVKIKELMDNKKIFLCDLSIGKIGEDNSTLLGSMIITQIQIATMGRAYQDPKDRIPFYLYVDEFQNFATGSFKKILSEARKYKLGLTLANQYITQIDEEVMGSIRGNVGTLTCFNIGAQDSEILVKEFGSKINPEDLTTLDKFQMITRLAIDNVTSIAFTSYSLPLPKNISGHREKIIEQSRMKYGIKIDKKFAENPEIVDERAEVQ